MDQKETFDWMRSELEDLRKENDELKAQIARMRAPVSAEEVSAAVKKMKWTKWVNSCERDLVNAALAARAEKEEQNGTR